MGLIDRETVNRILEAADIVEVVSDFVKLRRSGANYKGLCPFHNERTPSFSVNKARNICKCFSCGKGGSPVNFIMEHEQLSYAEALRYLARKYNIEIVERDADPAEREAMSRREALLAINDFALGHFRKNLTDTEAGRLIAMPYFRHRGLDDRMIERFALGYALEKSDDLILAARSAGFNPDYLAETGLAAVSERNGVRQMYDRFRGRVIFPIFSISGRVVGFGGRTMRTDKDIAKYVNSPESEIYHKNKELYGFYQAKNAIGRRDKCIMVEGYLDVISMHQAGVENVVASSGTSLTTGQIRAVQRFTDNVTLIYDADAAGIKASLRGINMLLAEKMNVSVLALPKGDDPDSFAQSHSSYEVEAYLHDHETDIVTFMADVLLAQVPQNDPIARAKVINIILDTVSYVDDPIKRQSYVALCSRRLEMDEDIIGRQLKVFATKHLEEKEKEFRREQARASLGADENGNIPESATDDDKTAAELAGVLDSRNNRLFPFERMLARYLVRYGLVYVADISLADGTTVPGTVFDLIDSELSLDEIHFTNPVYGAVFDKVRAMKNGEWPQQRAAHAAGTDAECRRRLDAGISALRDRGGSVVEIEKEEKALRDEIEAYRAAELGKFDALFVQTRLLNDADDDVRRTANELASDRYTLSRIYNREGYDDSEESQLKQLVPRAVNELRAAIVGGMLDDLNKRIRTAPADEAVSIMQRIAQYKEYQKRLLKALGERIILPR